MADQTKNKKNTSAGAAFEILSNAAMPFSGAGCFFPEYSLQN